MATMKTPGVYVVEKNAFPSSVVEVATAVPAFIGYTQFADNKGTSLLGQPWRITSLAEYHSYFGAGPSPAFNIREKKPADSALQAAFSVTDAANVKKEYLLDHVAGNYLLYYCMVSFFQNGGGPCYVVSVGGYDDGIALDRLNGGIEALVKEQEPTMVVVPEMVLLSEADCISGQQAMLAHCGEKMKNRFAILDIWNGYKDRQDPSGDCVVSFRDKLGINHLDFAAAYYPWIDTTIVQDTDLSWENIDNKPQLADLIRADLGLGGGERKPPAAEAAEEKGKKPTGGTAAPPDPKRAQQMSEIDKLTTDPASWKDVKSPQDISANKQLLDKSLRSMSPLYVNILGAVRRKLNLLPPAAAMAGVYTAVDDAQGVWKAPANISLNSVISPAVNITHEDQEDLNVTPQGKSINAIRSFIGEGVLVWGARTLDGNSLDWRYINVRRTMIMLEESIKLASKAYVFEANDANTWVTMKSMIRNFLTGIWKRGGLAGASPEEAFSVHIGLGETMTPEDILEGILRVTVLVAVTRPAEFIEITFQQQMQKS